MEMVLPKAPENYSSPFWAYKFSICSWERAKLLISMISGHLDMSPSPKTNIIYLWRPQDTFKNPRKSKFLWRTIICMNFKPLDIHNFENFWKDRHRQIPTTRLITSWKPWIWDQYLSKIWNGSLVIWDRWIFETLKLRNQETKKLWKP